ncbi:hypothetical protein H4582DRAFT_649235 [Lactarius indigo]|nr:hypothetical protein H4582DRAFT_649235 [Lactarius indigo]
MYFDNRVAGLVTGVCLVLAKLRLLVGAPARVNGGRHLHVAATQNPVTIRRTCDLLVMRIFAKTEFGRYDPYLITHHDSATSYLVRLLYIHRARATRGDAFYATPSHWQVELGCDTLAVSDN